MQPKHWRTFPLGALISILLAGVVFASIWVPELSQWYVRPAAITESGLQATRKAPERHILNEVAAMQLISVEIDPNQILAAAEQVTRGTLSLPGYQPAPITLPFAPGDLRRGLPEWQLKVASLTAGNLLLDAYRITRREHFFQQARDAIIAFAQYESTQWLDHGFMWNDHAVGARIPVLIKFWVEYRERPDFEPHVGRIVLNLVARSARLLAKSTFYAWRTDHGIMANLAILQIAAAFPELPEIAELRAVAIERIRNHLSYYIADEGVTLLHSAGYHSSGLYFFGMALRLFTLNDIEIPEDWWEKYAKAVDFYSLLRRPDGTLPMYGDTGSASKELGPPLTARNPTTGRAEPLMERKTWPRSDSFAVYPVAGHAIWWDSSPQREAAAANQTVITWSYHPGHGHKLADELSMIVWAHGRTWLTNAGYWPYGVWGREHAESWEASNAPHLFGESKYSERTSRVRGLGQGEWITFIDIERTGPQGYSVRRQIARILGADTWVVLDHFQDSAARTTTTNWTFYPDLVVTPYPAQGLYRVASRNFPSALWCSFSGSAGVATELVSGSKTPFAGWVVMDLTPVRAPAIMVRQPSRDTWSLATFMLSSTGQDAGFGNGARMSRWLDGNRWAVAIPTASGEVTLTREGDRLLIHRQGSPGADSPVALATLDAPAAEIKAVRDAFRSASENYRKFPEHFSYRVRVSYFLLAALAGQELLLFLAGLRLPRAARALRVASWVMWVAGGIWLSGVYFQVT